MEDRDWSDLPSMQNDNILSDSTCNEETRCSPNESSFYAHKKDDDVENENSPNKIRRSRIKETSNTKQEKESCPICLSSFEDRSFLDQCFHILFTIFLSLML